MSDALESLRRRMAKAVEDMEFELAARLRDEISLLRGSPDGQAAELTSGSHLRRQQPGSMGIGTSDQKMKPPPGWKRPKRPEPMTSVHKKPKGSR